MPFIGDTIKIHIEFKNWLQVYADPTSITLKIYDALKTQQGATVTIDSSYKVATGIYEYPYVVPDTVTGIYFTAEISATLEGNPVVTRQKFQRVWAND